MKKTILSLVVLATLSLTSCKNDKVESTEAVDAAVATEEASTYTVDASKSTIEWVGSKPAGKHNGTIALSKGELALNNGKVESGNFTIDMNSITVLDLTAADGKEDLEGHLKGLGKEEDADHFFNTKKFPEGTFEITSVATVDAVTTVSGNLTLKGITKPVSFPATIAVDGDNVTLNSETFKIDRTQWNVNYASKSVFDDLKDKFVNDEIELKVSITATK
ncbi:YceI family protein [Flavobacterium azooxidireducens]|uniref:YceI family protein n=1 Tax=Flavobacterium azooxidireducens TaxID=1871076 RepID=A0ABY4KFE5_9FLAO|nr:YceI family protein [Flavobacterium azooxidireducens]UPQ78493.1 YceI family protein [Flavobacterium azooxidireducens]